MFKIKRWNGKYGNVAKFVVQDSNGRFSEFDPTRPKDVAWVNQDLTAEAEYKNWEDFKDEPVEDLSDIVM